MSRNYQVSKILVPVKGFKARTQALCLAQMGVSNPRQANLGDGLWTLEDSPDNMKDVVFLNEGSGRIDAVSSAPADGTDGEYIIEEWEGHRDEAAVGHDLYTRYTFVRRRGDSDYEFMGEYAIEALFWGDRNQEIKKQKTLWKRV
jgi:hypothetical protein